MVELLGLTTFEFALLSAVYLFAGTVKGALGFGLPLVSISLSSLVLPVDLILVINAIVLFPTNFYQFANAGPMLPTIRRFWPVVAGLMITAPVAAIFITEINPRTLVSALGVMVMVFVIFTVISPKFSISTSGERPWGFATGLIAGAIGALTTSPGPVFVMYVVGLKLSRQLMVSSMGLFMMVVGITLTIAYWQSGLIDVNRFFTGICCLPIAAIGMVIGNRIAKVASAKIFSAVVLSVLFLLGANMVIRTLMT